MCAPRRVGLGPRAGPGVGAPGEDNSVAFLYFSVDAGDGEDEVTVRVDREMFFSPDYIGAEVWLFAVDGDGTACTRHNPPVALASSSGSCGSCKCTIKKSRIGMWHAGLSVSVQ